MVVGLEGMTEMVLMEISSSEEKMAGTGAGATAALMPGHVVHVDLIPFTEICLGVYNIICLYVMSSLPICIQSP